MERVVLLTATCANKQPFEPAGGVTWSGVGKETTRGADAVSRGVNHRVSSKNALAQVVAELGTNSERTENCAVSPAAATEDRDADRLVTLIGEALGPSSRIVSPCDANMV